MITETGEKRGRGRPRKNPPPTIVAKSTIVRRTVSSDVDGTGTEVLHSSLDFAGDNVVPIVRSAAASQAPGGANDPVLPAAPAIRADAGTLQQPAPRRRGRPPKNKTPLPAPDVTGDTAVQGSVQTVERTVVRRAAKTENVTASDATSPQIIADRQAEQNSGRIKPVITEGASPAGFKGPGVRPGKEVQIGNSKLSFFYIVFKNSEHDELLYPDTMHTIQHLLSAASKEADLPNIVKIMPCGSRIAMEVAVLDAHSDFAKNELRKLMLTAAYMDNIPKYELDHCANPEYQNYADAHREIREFIYTMYGITLDTRTADYSW